MPRARGKRGRLAARRRVRAGRGRRGVRGAPPPGWGPPPPRRLRGWHSAHRGAADPHRLRWRRPHGNSRETGRRARCSSPRTGRPTGLKATSHPQLASRPLESPTPPAPRAAFFPPRRPPRREVSEVPAPAPPSAARAAPRGPRAPDSPRREAVRRASPFTNRTSRASPAGFVLPRRTVTTPSPAAALARHRPSAGRSPRSSASPP